MVKKKMLEDDRVGLGGVCRKMMDDNDTRVVKLRAEIICQ